MSKRIWRGDSEAIAQEVKVTPGNVEIGDIFTLTINGKAVTYEAAAATVADVTAGLVAAWNASTIPEIAEVEAVDFETHLTLTAKTAGVPFTVTGATTNSTQASDSEITITETTPGVEPTNEQQVLTLNSPSTGGSFAITFDGQTTAALDFDITAAELKTALEALSNIAVGDLSVIGGPFPASPIYVTFGGAFAGTDVPLMTVDGTNLTGGGSVTVTTTREGSGKTNELHYISTQGVDGGTFSLTINGIFVGAFDVQTQGGVSTIQPAIDAAVGAGNCTMYSLETSSFIGSAYFLEFKGALAGINIPATVVGTSQLTNPAAVFVSTPSNGGGSAGNEFGFVRLANPSSGTFNLTINGTTTPPIDVTPENTLISRITDEIEAITGAGTVVVTPIKDYSDGLEFPRLGFWFEFINAAGNQAIEWSFNGSGLTTSPVAHHVRPGSSILTELQSVRVNGTGGTFTLTYDGQTTGSIAQGALASAVETALEALSNVTAVTVTGSGTAADPYVVEFVDPAGNVVAMTGDGSALTGGSGSSETTVESNPGTNEVQTITLVASDGVFRLGFRGKTTTDIAWNAAALDVETSLEALSTIGAGNVSVAGAAGGPYTVTFQVDLGSENVDPLTYDKSDLIGPPGVGDETLTLTITVSSKGPNDWSVAENWIDPDTGNSGVPVTGDDVFIEDGRSDILYGLDQSAVTLNSVKLNSRYAGSIGLPRRNPAGYWEYRDIDLQIGITTLIVGYGNGSGSPRTNIDLGAVQSDIEILNTGGSAEAGVPAVLLKGTHVLNSMLVIEGDVGFAFRAGEAGYLKSLVMRGGLVQLGPITLDTLDKTGGELIADETTINGAVNLRG